MRLQSMYADRRELGAEETEMRVLIVDDSRAARLALKKVLPASLQTNLIEVGGGVEALRVCHEETIELMILDLTMPEKDGYDVLEALQKAGRLPPTVVVSADIQPKAAERVKALGALAFLKKWPTRAELEATLAKAGIL